MSSHNASMHYAQMGRKRLLHRGQSYADEMTSPNQRLRAARKRWFNSAREAALAMGISPGTYAGHENGHRGFPATRAPTYARRFRVTEEWLLYGKGDMPEPAQLTDEILAEMIENAMKELPIGTPLGDFPRLVAPALREQLERFEADRGDADN